MAMQRLTIKRRTVTGKEVAKRRRREGAVPAILYDGQKAETVTVDPKAVLRMIHGHEGTTQLLTLKFDGEAGNGARLAIIRELQFDPVTEQLLHVDLQEVSVDRAITVHVTVRPVGEAAGVRGGGADGGGGHRARGPHRAQAERGRGGGRRRQAAGAAGESREVREGQVAGRGPRGPRRGRAGKPRSGVSGHPAQRGPARPR